MPVLFFDERAAIQYDCTLPLIQLSVFSAALLLTNPSAPHPASCLTTHTFTQHNLAQECSPFLNTRTSCLQRNQLSLLQSWLIA